VNTLWAALKPGSQVLSSVHYASPRPLAVPLLNQGSQSIFARLRSGGAGPVSAVKPRSSSGERQTAPAKARP
jgi:hypothetical protein